MSIYWTTQSIKCFMDDIFFRQIMTRRYWYINITCLHHFDFWGREWDVLSMLCRLLDQRLCRRVSIWNHYWPKLFPSDQQFCKCVHHLSTTALITITFLWNIQFCIYLPQTTKKYFLSRRSHQTAVLLAINVHIVLTQTLPVILKVQNKRS